MIRGVHQIAVSTSDLDRLVGFYTELFGFEQVMVGGWSDRPVVDEIVGLRGSAARQAMLRSGNAYLEIFEYSSHAGRPGPAERTVADRGYTHFCIDVQDIDSEYERLTAVGMRFHCPPPELAGGRVRATVTETIDSIEYHLFSNAFFFPGLQIPLCYRFGPDGPDHDRCLFEVLFLRPKPRSGTIPRPAEPVDLDDSDTTVPGMPAGLGQVLDRDTVNLAAQTRGFKASKKRGQTLGNYQEVRARHLQAMVHRYIVEGRAAIAGVAT